VSVPLGRRSPGAANRQPMRLLRWSSTSLTSSLAAMCSASPTNLFKCCLSGHYPTLKTCRFSKVALLRRCISFKAHFLYIEVTTLVRSPLMVSCMRHILQAKSCRYCTRALRVGAVKVSRQKLGSWHCSKGNALWA
jgi:hypothetical protein